ncbi:MAG: carboxymuconolactone decarboxylase family protein [Candidatus Nezhaarchaeales archaeon]
MSQARGCKEPIEALEVADRIDPQLKDAVKALYSFIWRDGALPLKFKHLIALALSICHGVEEKQAHKILARALEAGATREEIIETILVVTWFSGVPSLVASRSIIESLKS